MVNLAAESMICASYVDGEGRLDVTRIAFFRPSDDALFDCLDDLSVVELFLSTLHSAQGPNALLARSLAETSISIWTMPSVETQKHSASNPEDTHFHLTMHKGFKFLRVQQY
ncbi:hypothetical protein FE257_001830 [Aspergillus nanangensis]|uniref:Uncharacterized protein n=1 Tax=Aspergillus nanangensis TaxID=2582783 RepID=A0AAD4CDB2_ASPNN|nr:hypothetical protein FE257_001830 [Aspergillus nanangensis]